MDAKRERATFDPEVAVHEEEADLEYLGYDEDEWYESDEDRYGYWNDFNATERLKELFPKIDANQDGFVVKNEIHAWHHQNALNASLRRAESHFKSSDENEDGRLTLREYLAEYYHKFLDLEEFKEDEAEDLHVSDLQYFNKTRESFRLVDENGDGALELEEFYAYLHPEEANNAALHKHVVRHDLLDYDNDEDGKIGMTEFMDGLWYLFYTWTDEEDYDWSEEVDRERAEAKFKILDTNYDGLVEVDEVMPYYFELHPTEGNYARVQAEDLLKQADENEDGRLTLQEMLARPEIFYNMASGNTHSRYHDDYHDDYDYDYRHYEF